jgi:tRNA pseudouridine38-40 synthase
VTVLLQTLLVSGMVALCEDVAVRLRLDCAYDGTDFHGWAAQPSLRTVQGVVQEALSRILRLERVRVTCAGRTDTGVHARGQVVHLDVEPEALAAVPVRSAPDPFAALLRRLNGVLPDDVRVLAAGQAPEGFDARFSALWRRYAYRVADEPRLMDPLLRRSVLAWPRTLDLDAMNTAADALLGEHDFAAFCRRREGATTVRTLLELHWARDETGVAVAHVRADAFCHTMVRALTGCLVAVGEGRRGPDWPVEVLRAEVRDPAVTVLRAQGLTLEQVAYPEDAGLAARARESRVKRVRPGATGRDGSTGLGVCCG